MTYKNWAFGVLVANAVLSFPMAAWAADRDFCRDYTTAALRQVHDAEQTPFCARGLASNPTRWSEDRRVHFDWCRTASPDQVQAERDFRTHYIRECRTH
jgi:hypothetical protein